MKTIKQAQGFREWFRNKTGVTDVSVFFPNGTKKFGYDLAVPPQDLVSLHTIPSGPFPMMSTTGLIEGVLIFIGVRVLLGVRRGDMCFLATAR